jgi:hypothetical protein
MAADEINAAEASTAGKFNSFTKTIRESPARPPPWWPNSSIRIRYEL